MKKTAPPFLTTNALNKQFNMPTAEQNAGNLPSRILYLPHSGAAPQEQWLASTNAQASYHYPNVDAAIDQLMRGLTLGEKIQFLFALYQSGKTGVQLGVVERLARQLNFITPIALWHSFLPQNTLLEQNKLRSAAANLDQHIICTHGPSLNNSMPEIVRQIRDVTDRKIIFTCLGDETQWGQGMNQGHAEFLREAGAGFLPDGKLDPNVRNWPNPYLRVINTSASPTLIYDRYVLNQVDLVSFAPGAGYYGPSDILKNPRFLDTDTLPSFMANDAAVLRMLLDLMYEYYLLDPMHSHAVIRLQSSVEVQRAMQHILPSWAKSRGLPPQWAEQYVHAYGTEFQPTETFLTRIAEPPRFSTREHNPFQGHLLIQTIAAGIAVTWDYLAGWAQPTTKQGDNDGQKGCRNCGYQPSKWTNQCVVAQSRSHLENYTQEIAPYLIRGESPLHVQGPTTWTSSRPAPAPPAPKPPQISPIRVLREGTLPKR
ncbi:MAG: hypothetical protein ACO3FT_04885 [Ilumatobacteraceae bacterium]|jgi:hypothetical protein